MDTGQQGVGLAGGWWIHGYPMGYGVDTGRFARPHKPLTSTNPSFPTAKRDCEELQQAATDGGRGRQ